MSILNHPAGLFTSAARIDAAAQLQAALAERGLEVDIFDAGELVEQVADRLTPAPHTRRQGPRFNAGWTPADEARLVEDEALEALAGWSDEIGGDR